MEILHTVLLGFVKYFWRDVVQNQITNKTRDLLQARLSSFDVSGLGCSKLSGSTLVNYAGSLTGRDFRVIAQAAPFVLSGIVPPLCYDTWVALSKLIPLIWQPQIPDIDKYIVCRTFVNFLSWRYLISGFRKTCTQKSPSSWHAPQHGLPNGSTNQSSTTFSILKITYAAMDQLWYLQPSLSNRLILSFVQTASIQTARPHLVILPFLLPTLTGFGPSCVVGECGLGSWRGITNQVTTMLVGYLLEET